MVSKLSLLGALLSASLCTAATQNFRVIRVGSTMVARQSTSDPSCPANYVCKSTQCPGDVVCPAGEDCVYFGGILGCVESGSNVCALKPDTLEAVICPKGKGVCCHGNCYADGAVCCDFPNVKCLVGELCANACQIGQTCGRNSCEGGGVSSSTSTIAPTSSIRIPVTSSTTAIAPPTTSASSSSKSSSTTSASTSSPPTIGPTQVPSVDVFKLKGCFTDSSNDRTLKNGTNEDSRMTVEKCAESGQDWRYVGVASGSQCFWGNVQFNPRPSDANDCNTACGGDKSEACGGENRILLYENPDYIDPTNAIYVLSLKAWRTELDKMRGLIAEFYRLITIYNGQNHDKTSKRTAKRAPPGSILTQIINARNAVSSARPVLSSASNLVLRAAGRARAARVIDGNDYIELTSISSRTAQAAEAVSVADVASPATIRTAARVATQAITVFGAPEIVIAGVVALQAIGIFFTLFQFIASHENDGKGPGSTSISTTSLKPTKTSTTSTPSSSPTGVPRSRIATFTEDMTSAQFYATIAALVVAGNEITDLISIDKPVFYGFLGNIYDLDALILSKHPLIAGLGLNGMGQLDSQGRDLDLSTTESTDRPARANKSASTSEKQAGDRAADQPVKIAANDLFANSSSLLGRDLQLGDALEETFYYGNPVTRAWTPLPDEPFALQWLGSLWAQNGLTGSYVGYNSALIDRGLTKRVPVYLMDGGVDRSHPDFNGPVPQLFPFHIDVTEPNGLAMDLHGHGTLMAGCIVGKIGGTYKFADLIPVKVVLNNMDIPAWNVVNAMAQIMAKQQEIGNPGSVLSISLKFPKSKLQDAVNPLGNEPIFTTMHRLQRHNINVVMSAGNLPNEPLGDFIPRKYGGATTPFTVVGSVDANGVRSAFSSYIDKDRRGILSLHVMGERILVPRVRGGDYRRASGTSQATAMAAGMAARLLAENVLPQDIKSRLLADGIELKGSDWDLDDGYLVARAGIKIQVPCQDPVVPVLPIPTYTIYPGGETTVFAGTANFAPPATTISTCYNVASHTPAVLSTVTYTAAP